MRTNPNQRSALTTFSLVPALSLMKKKSRWAFRVTIEVHVVASWCPCLVMESGPVFFVAWVVWSWTCFGPWGDEQERTTCQCQAAEDQRPNEIKAKKCGWGETHQLQSCCMLLQIIFVIVIWISVLPGQLKQQRPLSTKSSGSMHSLGSTSSASSSSIQGVNPDRRRRVKSAAPGLRSRANERENDVPEDLQEASPASNHDDELPMPQKPTGSDRFKVKPLECVTQFTNDMKEMNSMEDDFKRNALELQRKLGISPEGMVYWVD